MPGRDRAGPSRPAPRRGPGPRPCPGVAGGGRDARSGAERGPNGSWIAVPEALRAPGNHAPFSRTPTGPALRSGDRAPKAKRERPASWKAPRQGRWSETASTVQRRTWRQLTRTTKDNVHHAICASVSGFWATFFAQGEGVERDHVRNLCVAKRDGLAGWLSEQYRAFGGECYAVYADGKFVNEAAQKALTNQRSMNGVRAVTRSSGPSIQRLSGEAPTSSRDRRRSSARSGGVAPHARQGRGSAPAARRARARSSSG